MRVLSRFYRRLFLRKLMTAHCGGRLHFFNGLAKLADPAAFAAMKAQTLALLANQTPWSRSVWRR